MLVRVIRVRSVTTHAPRTNDNAVLCHQLRHQLSPGLAIGSHQSRVDAGGFDKYTRVDKMIRLHSAFQRMSIDGSHGSPYGSEVSADLTQRNPRSTNALDVSAPRRPEFVRVFCG